MLLFRLTPAEARLASGEALEDAADALQVLDRHGAQSAEGHLSKTQTHRQAELVALLWHFSDLAISTSQLPSHLSFP